MPTAQFTNTIAANGVVANVLVGSQFEFTGRPTRIQLYIIQDPTAGRGQVEVFFGQELQATPAPISNATGVTIGPNVPDDLLVDDIAAPGDRIVVRLTETAGGAGLIVRTKVVLTPVA